MPVQRANFEIQVTATGGAAAAADINKVIGSNRELRDVLKLAGREAGGVLGPIGDLGEYLSDPFMLAAAGAGLAIKMLVERHKELMEQMTRQITVSREWKEAFSESQTAAIREHNSALEEWARRLEHLHGKIDSVADATARAIAVSREELTAVNNLTASREKLYNAYARLERAQGKISEPDEYRATEANRKFNKAGDGLLEDLAWTKAPRDRMEALEDERRRVERETKITEAVTSGNATPEPIAEYKGFNADPGKNDVDYKAITDRLAHIRDEPRGAQENAELEELLGAIFGLLEMLADHPGIRNAADWAQRLTDLENRITASRG